MAHDGKPAGPDRASVAFLALGITCLVASALMLLGGDPDWAHRPRRVFQGIIVGAALVALAVLRMRERSDAGPGEAESDRGDEGTDKGRVSEEGGAFAQNALDGLLLRSDNVVLTLRDLVAHGSAQADYGMLPALLVRAGLMDWREAPALGASKLRRNGRWWLSSRADELSDADHDRLLSVEGALNVNEDLLHRPWPTALSDEERVRQIVSGVSSLEPLSPPQGTATPFLLEGALAGGEWECRVRFADFCENVPAPFRVDVNFQANVSAGTLCADTLVPRPRCFSFVEPDDPRGRAEAARSYALGVALLLGRGALASSPALERATINCRERADGEVILSLDLARGDLDRLTSAVERLRARQGAASLDDPAVRWSPDGDGWLLPVEPFVRCDEASLNPPSRFREVDLDDAPCDGRLAAACGAQRVSDLGIMEKAGRANSWNAVVGRLGTTTQEAVSKLVDLRDATNDLTVAEACERTSKALVEGTVDVSNRRELALLFVDGGSLDRATGRAREILDADPTPEDLEEALGVLDDVLAPITQMGIYLDDNDSVYRYFNSVAERVLYNRTQDDRGRKVRLVPDEYYGAHSSAARILNLLDRTDEALSHADELMRMAPVTPDAALAKVRCLERQSRIFEATDLLKRAISYCSTARDLSICFYRLAYMQWKLGRSDLAVACYQRSLKLHSEMADQARSELADLVASDDALRRLSDAEVLRALDDAGIPAGAVDRIRTETRDALAACADAGIFSVARPLASVLLEFGRDDALVDVCRSLMRP